MVADSDRAYISDRLFDADGSVYLQKISLCR